MYDFSVKVLTARPGVTHLFAVGQAGFIIKSSNGQLLGIDLYLSECVERVEGHVGFKRLLPKLLDPFALHFDCIIATHPHFDHFDMDAIPQIMSNHHTKLFASVNCEKEVERLNMTGNNTNYVAPGDVANVGDYSLEFVECDHGVGAPDAVGVIVTVDHKRIYFTGDTALRLDRVEKILSNGQIDILLAPINGAYGNMNELECAQLSDALKAHVTIPCHFGMFASHGGNPGLFIEIMNEQYPDRPYMLLSQGEGIIIG